jgi:hypothetical protein
MFLYGPPEALLVADAGVGADLGVLAQYGVLGIIAAMLIWFAKSAHQRERERADRLEEENKRLNMLILDRVIPALTSATRAAEESAELLNAVQREREYAQLADQRRRPKGGDV